MNEGLETGETTDVVRLTLDDLFIDQIISPL
jgi:hypothetical protein